MHIHASVCQTKLLEDMLKEENRIYDFICLESKKFLNHRLEIDEKGCETLIQ